MELKDIIAQNIIELRKQNKLTQAELAEKLNYTDKAISKWERGESIPEISTLKRIAEIFNCTVDVLLTENATKELKKYALPRNIIINQRIIAAAASMVVWCIATIAFLYFPPLSCSPCPRRKYSFKPSLVEYSKLAFSHT